MRRRTKLRLAFWVVSAFGIGAFAMARLQAGMMYFPRPYTAAERAALERDGLWRIPFATRAGDMVAYYKGPPAGEADTVWLVFSGNGGRATDYRDIAAAKNDGYLFVDYPGYGDCEGKPSPRRIDANSSGAVAALEKAAGLEAGALRPKLAAFGHSLGAAAALRAAVEFEMDRVVIVSPFTTMKEMAARVAGKLLANLVTHRYDNVGTLAALIAARPDVNVTILHGTRDEIIPVAMGRDLAAAHPDEVRFLPIEGGDHNSIVARAHREIVAAMAGKE